MNYRTFGKTELKISEVGFGTWGLGGAYGAVNINDSLNALAKAEELGCNFIDTASFYGNAEEIVGSFLQGRRNRWILATKVSSECPGSGQFDIIRNLELQLKTLKTDYIDFYQLHWIPFNYFYYGGEIFGNDYIYDLLYKLKKSGKVRFIGCVIGTRTSKNNELMEEEIKNALKREIDGIQIPISLFSAEPFLSYRKEFKEKGLGILARSCLERGFLTGKFNVNSVFGAQDNRLDLTQENLIKFVDQSELFRFLDKEAESMTTGAVLYPLSFPEVSSVLLGTKTVEQAEINFGNFSNKKLTEATLEKIRIVQQLNNTKRLTD